MLLALVCAGAVGAAGGLRGLSDEFNGPALSGWSTTLGDDFGDGNDHAVSVEDGSLTLVPKRSWWVDDKQALYVSKTVAGDFVATMRVHVSGVNAEEPDANWTLSGILVRNPRSTHANENWIAFRTGAVSGSRVYERKTTVRSHSVLVLSASPGGWVDLRVARVGSWFFLLKRSPAGAWTQHWRYSRPDLPRTLQVGIDAFSGDESPHADLIARIDWFHFAPTGIPGPKRNAQPQQLLPYLKRV